MYILPKPQKCIISEKQINLNNFKVIIGEECDYRITKITNKLISENAFLSNNNKNDIYISVIDNRDEGYEIIATEDNIQVKGHSMAGAFYAVQTLRQIFSQADNRIINAFEISDTPDLLYRGFYQDATRGRVPTVKGAKRLIDILASQKINSLQYYVEHTFEFEEYKGINDKFGYFTADEIREIDDYCYDNFIDFIPSLATFGHLYELLQSDKYKHLCQKIDYVPCKHYWTERQQHHTIDPYNEESIKVILSLIDQYTPLFRSKYFNICCDETFDLCSEKNKDRNKAEAYVFFVLQIVEHLQAKGKIVMMWGDEVANLPHEDFKNVIMLNWGYSADPSEEKCIIAKNKNFNFITVPGTTSWSRFLECPQVSVPNITKMAQFAYKHGAMGVLNTNWGDYGHVSHLGCALFGLTVGGAISWNKNTIIDTEFENAVSFLVYKSSSNKIIKLLYQISEAHENLKVARIVDWRSYAPSFIGTIDSLQTNTEKAYRAIEELKSVDADEEILSELLSGARGTALLNKIILFVKYELGDKNQILAEFKEWFVIHRNIWLKWDKISEVDEIYNATVQVLNDAELLINNKD